MTGQKLEKITLYCWNYLKGALGGQSVNIEITKERYCDSSCENYWCPLNKLESTKEQKP